MHMEFYFENNKLFAVCLQNILVLWFIRYIFHAYFTNYNSKQRSIFILSGLNYVASSSIFDPFVEEGQFEDVSKIQKAFCWQFFLLDKTNQKAKCKVKISDGNFCDRIISSKACNKHLKIHGIDIRMN